jgi:UTP:GlnB (protein PII) uridylyltransferase
MSRRKRLPAFYETMPERYRQLFRGPTVDEHAAVAARRGGAPAHAEIWRRLPQGGAIACIVAEDRPGVLSYLGTVLTTRSIDILSAQVYARANPFGSEVLDLFWIRRDEGSACPVDETDLVRIADLLSGLMTGELRMDGRPLGGRHVASPECATLVRFEETLDRGSATLSLETNERPGLLRAVTNALAGAGVRVHDSRRAGSTGGRVIHRFSVAEKDGRVPDQFRRGVLQAEVLGVAELLTRSASTSPAYPAVEAHFDEIAEGPPSSLQ